MLSSDYPSQVDSNTATDRTFARDAGKYMHSNTGGPTPFSKTPLKPIQTGKAALRETGKPTNQIDSIAEENFLTGNTVLGTCDSITDGRVNAFGSSIDCLGASKSESRMANARDSNSADQLYKNIVDMNDDDIHVVAPGRGSSNSFDLTSISLNVKAGKRKTKKTRRLVSPTLIAGKTRAPPISNNDSNANEYTLTGVTDTSRDLAAPVEVDRLNGTLPTPISSHSIQTGYKSTSTKEKSDARDTSQRVSDSQTNKKSSENSPMNVKGSTANKIPTEYDSFEYNLNSPKSSLRHERKQTNPLIHKSDSKNSLRRETERTPTNEITTPSNILNESEPKIPSADQATYNSNLLNVREVSQSQLHKSISGNSLKLDVEERNSSMNESAATILLRRTSSNMVLLAVKNSDSKNNQLSDQDTTNTQATENISKHNVDAKLSTYNTTSKNNLLEAKNASHSQINKTISVNSLRSDIDGDKLSQMNDSVATILLRRTSSNLILPQLTRSDTKNRPISDLESTKSQTKELNSVTSSTHELGAMLSLNNKTVSKNNLIKIKDMAYSQLNVVAGNSVRSDNDDRNSLNNESMATIQLRRTSSNTILPDLPNRSATRNIAREELESTITEQNTNMSTYSIINIPESVHPTANNAATNVLKVRDVEPSRQSISGNSLKLDVEDRNSSMNESAATILLRRTSSNMILLQSNMDSKNINQSEIGTTNSQQISKQTIKSESVIGLSSKDKMAPTNNLPEVQNIEPAQVKQSITANSFLNDFEGKNSSINDSVATILLRRKSSYTVLTSLDTKQSFNVGNIDELNEDKVVGNNKDSDSMMTPIAYDRTGYQWNIDNMKQQPGNNVKKKINSRSSIKDEDKSLLKVNSGSPRKTYEDYMRENRDAAVESAQPATTTDLLAKPKRIASDPLIDHVTRTTIVRPSATTDIAEHVLHSEPDLRKHAHVDELPAKKSSKQSNALKATLSMTKLKSADDEENPLSRKSSNTVIKDPNDSIVLSAKSSKTSL